MAVKCWSDSNNPRGLSLNELVAAGIPGDGDDGLFHTETQIQTQPQPAAPAVGHVPRGERNEDSPPVQSRQMNFEHGHYESAARGCGLRGHGTRGSSEHQGSVSEPPVRSRQVNPERRNYETRTAARGSEHSGGYGTPNRDGGEWHEGSTSECRCSARERQPFPRTAAGHQNQQGSGEWWVVLDGANPGIYAT